MSRKRSSASLAAADPTPPGQVVKATYVGRLETVDDWRRQIAKIYREMRRGELPHEEGTRLTYVANIGASLAKVEQELRVLQTLHERMVRMEAEANGRLAPAPPSAEDTARLPSPELMQASAIDQEGAA